MFRLSPVFLLALLATGCASGGNPRPSNATAPPESAALDDQKKEGNVVSQYTTQWAGSGKANITELTRGENVFLGKLWLAPGAKVPEHQDETEEYLYILQGSGTLTLNGKTHIVTAGSTIYMPAKATVSFENNDQPLEAIQVFSGPEPAKKYAQWGARPSEK
jgi:quercetin dioxygenase-like cupin family protein